MRFHHPQTSHQHQMGRWSLCHVSFTRMVRPVDQVQLVSSGTLAKYAAIVTTWISYNVCCWVRFQPSTAQACVINTTIIFVINMTGKRPYHLSWQTTFWKSSRWWTADVWFAIVGTSCCLKWITFIYKCIFNVFFVLFCANYIVNLYFIWSELLYKKRMFSHIAKIVGIVDFQAKILINVGQLYKKCWRALL